MAASIETVTYLAYLRQRFRLRLACDLGSGYSSAVLRMFGAVTDSVDDDPDWLDRTAGFLEQWNLPRGGLYDWDGWLAAGRTYDLMFVDYSAGEQRNMAIRYAPERLRPGGVLVYDDAQNDGHREVMGEVALEHGLVVLPVRKLTVDEIGRYAAAMVRR